MKTSVNLVLDFVEPDNFLHSAMRETPCFSLDMKVNSCHIQLVSGAATDEFYSAARRARFRFQYGKF